MKVFECLLPAGPVWLAAACLVVLSFPGYVAAEKSAAGLPVIGEAQQILQSHGISLEAVYTGEFRKGTIYQDNLDLIATLDTEQAGLWSGGRNSYKVGIWHHSADRTVAGQIFGSDYGMYSGIDQPLFTAGNGLQLGSFVQLGWVPKQRNEITRYVGAGLHCCRGWLFSRPCSG